MGVYSFLWFLGLIKSILWVGDGNVEPYHLLLQYSIPPT